MDLQGKIEEFLKEKGYAPNVTRKFLDAKIDATSIHLLTHQDFQRMGIALGHARLIIETFVKDTKKNDLAKCVTNLRSDRTKKNKSVMPINIDLGWKHFDHKKRKYITVPASHGGGIRTRRVSRDTLVVSNIQNICKEVFFPQGRSKRHGPISLMVSSIAGNDDMDIDQNMTVEEYSQLKAFKSVKFYLKTKLWSDSYGLTDSESSDDFEPVKKKKSSCLTSTRKGSSTSTRKGSSTLTMKESSSLTRKESSSVPTKTSTPKSKDVICFSESDDGDDDQTNIDACTSQSNLVSMRALRAEQDKEFEECLKKDREKDKESLESAQRSQYLANRQRERGKLVNPEPDPHEPKVMVNVNHIVKGRIKRSFHVHEKISSIYHWVGSLSESPELFSLSVCTSPGNFTQLNPNNQITDVSNQLIMMTETQDSNLTIDILFNPQNKVTDEQNEEMKFCPVCQGFFPPTEILRHASLCADNKYQSELKEPDSDQSINDNHGGYDLIAENDINEFTVAEFETIYDEFPFKLDSVPFKLRVKRGFEFKNFVNKFSENWAKLKIGHILKIDYCGESGIDEGGLKREFFCESLKQIRDCYFTIHGDSGYLPRTDLLEDYSNGSFWFVGVLVAYSIHMNGPAPNFFHPLMYKYMTGNEQTVLDEVPSSLPSNSRLAQKYQKLYTIKEQKGMKLFFETDEGFDLLEEIGFRGVPSTIKFENKKGFLRSLFAKHMLPLFPCLKQIADGMEQLHLISLIRKKPKFFYNLFCNQKKFRWDFETVEESIRPNFSANGSNKREKEIDSYKSFIDCLEDIYHDEGSSRITFSKFMKFLVGTDTAPALGLQSLISINFIHDCSSDCTCKLKVSTCTLTISLPVHYKDIATMKQVVEDSVLMCHGFDSI